MSSAGHESFFCRRVTRRRVMLFYQRVTRHKFSALETCFNADARSHCCRSNSPLSAQRPSSTPAGGQSHPSPPSGHPSPQMSANLIPLHPAVILHPCWRPISLLSTQQSSSTYPSGGQTLPSPTSVMAVKLSLLRPAVMAVNLSALRLAVILHPHGQPTSPLPTCGGARPLVKGWGGGLGGGSR